MVLQRFVCLAICKKAKDLLKDTNVGVATVIGFPFGYSAIEAKLAEVLFSHSGWR